MSCENSRCNRSTAEFIPSQVSTLPAVVIGNKWLAIMSTITKQPLTDVQPTKTINYQSRYITNCVPRKTYCVFLSLVRVALKRTGFGVFEVTVSQLCGQITAGVQSDVPLPLHVYATGFVDDALRNTVPRVSEALLQLVNAVIRFCVMSGSVET